MSKTTYILRLTVILFLITAVVAALLGGVNYITADKIAQITKEKTDAAMATVLPADEYTEQDFTDDTGLVDAVYQAGDAGYVVQTTVSGSQGMITLMVGVDPDGAVTGISIIDQAETPGLGAVYADQSARGVAFRESFAGLSGSVGVADVEAISGATVSATAICQGVSAATACVAR